MENKFTEFQESIQRFLRRIPRECVTYRSDPNKSTRVEIEKDPSVCSSLLQPFFDNLTKIESEFTERMTESHTQTNKNIGGHECIERTVRTEDFGPVYKSEYYQTTAYNDVRKCIAITVHTLPSSHLYNMCYCKDDIYFSEQICTFDKTLVVTKRIWF